MSVKSQSKVSTQSPPHIWEEESNSTTKDDLGYGRLISQREELTSYWLTKENFIFGRDSACDCSFQKLGFISGRHFEISRDREGCACIKDCSRYGTFVNKEKISEGTLRRLSDGDIISAGQQHCQIFLYLKNGDEDNLPIELRKKYELSKSLGSGGFGVVKQVFDKATHRAYAMKIVPCYNNDVTKETDVFQLVKHPFIVNFRECLLTDAALYIVMEYMNDGNLESFLKDGLNKGLNEFHIKYLFYQVAIATQHLHQRKIIHRDIKPENILIKKYTSYRSVDIVIKLADFGLSKLLDEHSKAETCCGTRNYAAPEVLAYQPYNYTADIWSLGILLYYMLTKKFPFFVNIRNDLGKESSLDLQDLSDISDHAIAIIKAMLVREPSMRIKINEIMQHPWVQEDQPIQQKLKAVFEEEKENMSNEFEMARFPFS